VEEMEELDQPTLSRLQIGRQSDSIKDRRQRKLEKQKERNPNKVDRSKGEDKSGVFVQVDF